MTWSWDETADVVVVGFGAAGACAAVEAADAGARVLVLDRFAGGGTTAISGGVVYAGGGTRQQRAAGVTDTPQAMADYLREEAGDAVSAATLRRFCEQSAGMVDWLAGLTLGGLRVDEETGQALGAAGDGVPGLYAAGRCAVGICSRSYVSGLSLADCVFSGRRAGRSAAIGEPGDLHAHQG